MTWTTKKQDIVDALDEMSEQIGKLRSLVDHLPENSPVVKQLCNNCDHLSDRHHEADPLGERRFE